MEDGDGTRKIQVVKDTVEHVLDAVHNFHVVQLLEQLANVVEAREVRRQPEALATRFRMQRQAEVQLSVAHEDERVAAVVGVHALCVDEAFELKRKWQILEKQ